jgi:AcrR family transcriptional regulator
MARPGPDAVPRHVLILEAAQAMFLADGYSAVTMDRLAARAKVSKLTLYSRFPHKEAVFAAVVKNLWQALLVNLEDPETLIGDPDSALPSFGMRLLRLLLRPRSVATFRLWAGEAGRNSELAGKLEARALEPIHRVLTSYLRREATRGTLTVTDPRMAAAQFLGLILQPTFWPYVLGLRAVVFRPRDTVSAACRIFLAAYAPRRRLTAKEPTLR